QGQGEAGRRQQQQQLQQALLCGPGEVGHLAVQLLRMLYDTWAALEAMGAYRRRGTVGRDNDLVHTDRVLCRALTKELAFKEPGNIVMLLQCLPPAAAVRLLVCVLGEAAHKRTDGGQMSGRLRDVVDYYIDKGVGQGAAPKALASDALRYLVEEAANPHHHNSGSNWTWAAAAIRFNNLPYRCGGLALLVPLLAAAALQQAAQEQRRLAAAAGAADGTGCDEDEEEGGSRAAAAAWAAEAAAVAELYRRAVERLEAEGA
ncbi:hypothetical protein Agub_g5377, partial [Astrephomene gubernaculifera]